jgi:hypothetical protein
MVEFRNKKIGEGGGRLIFSLTVPKLFLELELVLVLILFTVCVFAVAVSQLFLCLSLLLYRSLSLFKCFFFR